MNSETNVAKGAALLTISEVGLGSVLHGLHLPLSGELLSLNQIGILSMVARENRGASGRYTELEVSNVAAILKSLSPAGKKLTPMLAISMQGILFNAGTIVLGRGVLGLCFGSVLSGLWSFVQPLVLYWIFYGNDLFRIGDFYLAKLHEAFSLSRQELVLIGGAAVALKILLSLAVALMASVNSDSYFSRLQKKILVFTKGRKVASQSFGGNQPRILPAMRLALGDLLNPVFLLSLILSGIFFYYAETAASQIVWKLMRPVAVGLLVFYAARRVPITSVLSFLERRGLGAFAQTFRDTLESLKKI